MSNLHPLFDDICSRHVGYSSYADNRLQPPEPDRHDEAVAERAEEMASEWSHIAQAFVEGITVPDKLARRLAEWQGDKTAAADLLNELFVCLRPTFETWAEEEIEARSQPDDVL